jgi:hypothetical protein
VKLVKERPSKTERFASAISGRDVELFPTYVQLFRSLDSRKDKSEVRFRTHTLRDCAGMGTY